MRQSVSVQVHVAIHADRPENPPTQIFVPTQGEQAKL
jgi:hypothetical protein